MCVCVFLHVALPVKTGIVILRLWGEALRPCFLFQPNTCAGTCMSIGHIYMRPSRLKRYIQSNPVDTTPTGNTP